MRKVAGSKKFLAAVVLSGGLLVAGSLFAQDAGSGGGGGRRGGGGPRTLTGVVSDSMCGATHKMPDAAKCTAGCVKGGGKYALVVGDRVITLEEAPAADLEKLAGQKASVTGTMSGRDAMKVTKVEAAKG